VTPLDLKNSAENGETGKEGEGQNVWACRTRETYLNTLLLVGETCEGMGVGLVALTEWGEALWDCEQQRKGSALESQSGPGLPGRQRRPGGH
jgi:hypothetical protein